MAERVAVEMTVAASGWRRSVPKLAQFVRQVIGHAVREATAKGDPTGGRPIVVSLLLADDRQVQRLNREWRGQDKPTNVLSFPALDEFTPPGCALPLGDIVLALETVRAEARSQDKELAGHMAHLLVHGVLHLLGYDHEESRSARRMEALERQTLQGLGIKDPYAERKT
jgi:probable rRNA maturation factor